MQLHAASKSSRSWLAGGRGAFSSGENLLRYRVSPLVIATDASESGFGVVRSSTLTLRGSDELSLRALSTATACDQLGIIELGAGISGL